MMKKFFAILMIVTMVVCYMPTVAFADSGNTQEPPTNATGDDCVEQENPDYSTLINDCDFTFYCTPGGGKIEEDDWGEYHFGRKTFPMLSGYCKFKAIPNEGWVFNEWKHEISRDAYEKQTLFGKVEIIEEFRAENTSWTTTQKRYAFSPNGSEIELRRGPSKYETKWAKLHYVVHAHFNPKITVTYEGDGSFTGVNDGGNVVANYKEDKVFTAQDGYAIDTVTVTDLNGNSVSDSCFTNNGDSITFNKVTQPLNVKVTFKENGDNSKPQDNNASFFFHAGGNNYFPAHSLDSGRNAIMGPLVGKVESGKVKTEPDKEQLKSAIQDYYRLTDEEMVDVKWEWKEVKGKGAGEGGLECWSCPYHVDGVALDKEGHSLKIKYSMEYLVDGEHHYTARLDEETKNTHEGVPTPTKPGYDFNGWKLVTEGADDKSVSQDLTYEATWTEKPSYDASFFIKPDGEGAPDNPNDGFPESGFLPNGDAHKALQGKVYGPATGKDAVKEAIKTEPKREDIINVIRGAYQLDEQEEQAVDFRWYVIKSMNDGCEYHVDGVPVLDKGTDNERVLKRYKITYQDDAGKVLYSARANAGEDIPGYVGDTPTKEGYIFDGWAPLPENGKVSDHLILKPKWKKTDNPDKPPVYPTHYYTVKWNNYDNTNLETDYCTYYQMPTYDSATPVRPADEKYTYKFIGWDKEVVRVTGDAVYTAQFKAVAKEQTKPEDPADPTNPDKPGRPDKPAKPAKPEKPAKPDKPETEVPKTGDTSADNMIINLFLLTSSALAAVLLWYRKYARK
ncbi:MAG: InlB B-repeat-containing protein [Firmicutes bacterium]|nr:InlB B-repeat-containing protein [Bacillota bacterium]